MGEYETNMIAAIEALEASEPEKRSPAGAEAARWNKYIELRRSVFDLLATNDMNRAVVYQGRCYKMGPYGSLDRFKVDVLEKPEGVPA